MSKVWTVPLLQCKKESPLSQIMSPQLYSYPLCARSFLTTDANASHLHSWPYTAREGKGAPETWQESNEWELQVNRKGGTFAIIPTLCLSTLY